MKIRGVARGLSKSRLAMIGEMSLEVNKTPGYSKVEPL